MTETRIDGDGNVYRNGEWLGELQDGGLRLTARFGERWRVERVGSRWERRGEGWREVPILAIRAGAP